MDDSLERYAYGMRIVTMEGIASGIWGVLLLV